MVANNFQLRANRLRRWSTTGAIDGGADATAGSSGAADATTGSGGLS
ncbi:hypothetical protein HCA61_03440 [Rhodococcus sp. HNM0563]|nr:MULTISPECIES: hypothetical protein [unclassified Rhodococcus (in: high G+C Gram-positive bacteria)]MCK0092790.1 hypothetical protein [Rhodococcus sp. F64268]NLU61316.1 hypothetical protein [Rhodococcus sp. HNM0563]